MPLELRDKLLLTPCLVYQFLADFTVLESLFGCTPTEFIDGGNIAVDFLGNGTLLLGRGGYLRIHVADPANLLGYIFQCLYFRDILRVSADQDPGIPEFQDIGIAFPLGMKRIPPRSFMLDIVSGYSLNTNAFQGLPVAIFHDDRPPEVFKLLNTFLGHNRMRLILHYKLQGGHIQVVSVMVGNEHKVGLWHFRIIRFPHDGIDLLYETDGRWTAVDYKTDDVDGRTVDERFERYRAQALVYAAALRRLGIELDPGLYVCFVRCGAARLVETGGETAAEAEELIRELITGDRGR